MEFESITNFRELGNIKNKNGKKIKEHLLLRSGQLNRLSKDDSDILRNKYNLDKVVDMRTQEEIDNDPDIQIQGVENIHLDFLKTSLKVAPSLKDMVSHKDADPIKHMKGIYYDLITRNQCQSCFISFIDILINANGAVLWHCFAGKDRTGLSAALILYLLDVEYEEIKKDYLLTNEMRKEENNNILGYLRQEGLSDSDLEKVEIMLGVKEEFLDYAIEVIKEEFESVENYVENILGINKELKVKLQDKYLI
ncbi:MAG: tyrosine-protein phosphatase [Erysipelotrichales bacterium]